MYGWLIVEPKKGLKAPEKLCIIWIFAAFFSKISEEGSC